MNVCEPVLEREAIFDSYACRKGKGQRAAVRRAEGYARQHGWFLKMDVRKYFDSVDQRVLLGRKFKDHRKLIRETWTASGWGRPVPSVGRKSRGLGTSRPDPVVMRGDWRRTTTNRSSDDR